jgi:dinuclear metal center YbgI/SA1388 family protein
MYNLTDFYRSLCEIAPIELSLKSIERGDYDNSGILVKQSNSVSKVLFCLDLTESAVKRAVREGVDTIVTHHPAIYSPVKSLDFEGDNKALLLAIKKGLNIISMHLNLDFASGGIDAVLAQSLGAKNHKILDYITETNGYGREFEIEKTTLKNYLAFAKKTLGTKKIIAFGNNAREIKKVATFCGGGSGTALAMVRSGKTDADLIVSADIPHHIILELLERGKAVLELTHYSAEIIGFKAFVSRVVKATNGDLQTVFFEDRRFM